MTHVNIDAFNIVFFVRSFVRSMASLFFPASHNKDAICRGNERLYLYTEEKHRKRFIYYVSECAQEVNRKNGIINPTTNISIKKCSSEGAACVAVESPSSNTQTHTHIQPAVVFISSNDF